MREEVGVSDVQHNHKHSGKSSNTLGAYQPMVFSIAGCAGSVIVFTGDASVGAGLA